MKNQATINEITPELLGNRAIIRDNAVRGDDTFNIELDKIIILEGFNVRTDYGDLQELANSILENGQTMPGRVDILKDGTFVLVDGHRRFKALQLLAEQGHQPYFMALVNKSKTSDEQRILQMFTSQDNKQLLPHEVADLIQKLINLGHNQKSIAKKISKSPSYVNKMLDFSRESQAVKNEVAAGRISVSTVSKLRKAIPNEKERSKKIAEAVSENTSGKRLKQEQVTKEDVKETLAQKLTDAIVAHFIIGSPNHLKQLIKNNL